MNSLQISFCCYLIGSSTARADVLRPEMNKPENSVPHPFRVFCGMGGKPRNSTSFFLGSDQTHSLLKGKGVAETALFFAPSVAKKAEYICGKTSNSGQFFAKLSLL
jgi:hypothetical protein